MDNVVKVFVNVMEVIQDHVVMFHVRFLIEKLMKIFLLNIILADLCVGVICYQGTCYEGRCSCFEGYTGTYCDTSSMKRDILRGKNIYFVFQIIGTTPSPPPPPPLLIASTTARALLVPVGPIGPKTGQLIDYGRLLGGRAGPVGWILALVAGLLLLPLALAFAARQCTQGGCLPVKPGTTHVPVTIGAT